MPREILVPMDGSDSSRDALEFTLEHHPGAELTAHYVIDNAPSAGLGSSATGYKEEFHNAQRMLCKDVLSEAKSKAAKYGRDIETNYDRGHPPNNIIEFAEDRPIDQIVMGSHGRTGLSRIVLGSVAEKVVRHSPVPVTIVRSDTETA